MPPPKNPETNLTKHLKFKNRVIWIRGGTVLYKIWVFRHGWRGTWGSSPRKHARRLLANDNRHWHRHWHLGRSLINERRNKIEGPWNSERIRRWKVIHIHILKHCCHVYSGAGFSWVYMDKYPCCGSAYNHRAWWLFIQHTKYSTCRITEQRRRSLLW